MSTQAKASKRIRSNKRILSVTIKRMVDDSPDTSWLGEYAKSPNSEFSIDRAHSEDCIENDSLQKEKLERIASWIENDKPTCEAHGFEYAEGCADCTGERSHTRAMEQVLELAECDCCEHGDMGRGEYRYFNPSFNYVDEDGHLGADYKDDPNGAAEVRKCVRQDYERMESLNRGHWCFIGIRAEAEVVNLVVPEGPEKWHGTVQRISSGGLWSIESDSDDSHFAEVAKDELSNLKDELLAVGFSKRAIATAFKNPRRWTHESYPRRALALLRLYVRCL
jgi:hypothetical protein